MLDCDESLRPLALVDIQGQERGSGVRQGEGCHMIGSSSGELLKKPSQQSGQGHTLVLMPKEREKPVNVGVCTGEWTKTGEGEGGGVNGGLLYMFSSPGSLIT